MADKTEPQKKDLIWTERINKLIQNWRSFSKLERQQYRTDTIAILCRGLPEADETKLKRGL